MNYNIGDKYCKYRIVCGDVMFIVNKTLQPYMFAICKGEILYMVDSGFCFAMSHEYGETWKPTVI